MGDTIVVAPSKPKADKPWDAYKRESGRLLEPGYCGMLTDDELEYIQSKLMENADLARWWGFKPSMKSRSEAAIIAVAEYGSPEERRVNVELARKRSARVRPE